MPDRKVVLTEDAKRFADQMGIQLFETSAKDNKNVEEMFNAITSQVLHTKKEQKEQASTSKETVVLGKGKKPTKKRCCWKVITSSILLIDLIDSKCFKLTKPRFNNKIANSLFGIGKWMLLLISILCYL